MAHDLLLKSALKNCVNKKINMLYNGGHIDLIRTRIVMFCKQIDLLDKHYFLCSMESMLESIYRKLQLHKIL